MRLVRRAGRRPMLFDGAIGTWLIARGLRLENEAPESWNLTHPEELQSLHAAYAAAGAEVLQTNTFGGSRPRLQKRGLASELLLVNRRAVELARAAAGATPGDRPVAASLGPTGIDPFARDAAARIREAYEEQIAVLAAAGVAALHFETMYHPVEAAAAVRAAETAAPRLPVIVSATYALGDQGFQTPLGIDLARMHRAALDAGPDAVGVNCSLEARKMLGLVEKLRALTELPLVVQPQGGPAEVDCRAPRRDRAAQVAEFVRGALQLVDAGADAIGGCCGAGPEHIAALATALAAR